MMLNQCFREAKKRKIIAENPMEDLKRPKSRKQKRKVRAMTIEEQQKFLKVLQTERVRYKEQMLISMYTGMRMGEVNALKVSDVNFSFEYINLPCRFHR